MKIETLFIDRSIPRDEEVDHILSRLAPAPQTVDSSRVVYDHINQAADPISTAKKTLYITRNRGAVIKECPGTCEYTCCDYTILHSGTFCTMDCSYCILQAYFHPPVLRYFAGLDMLKQALDRVFKQEKIFRIGTGEYTDSLIWEPVSLLPRFLVDTFSGQDNCLLELKTKTVNIDSLLDLDHNRKTVLAWSVNTPEIIRSEEKGTAALSARLKAAQKAEAAGYPLAFHFDPVVIYPGCETGYLRVIRSIFTHVNPENIVWISIGTFRFMPKLKPIIEKRFRDSTICYGEFIPGLDNKMRYFKPLRLSIYRAMVSEIKRIAPDVFVYFCMEDREIWQKTMNFFPENEGELGFLLDQSAARHCGLNNRYLK